MGSRPAAPWHPLRNEIDTWWFEVGGGALEEYRRGSEIPRLLWRMRLRHQQTLESYIQETAADSFLAQLSPECRRRIFLMSDFLIPYWRQFLQEGPIFG